MAKITVSGKTQSDLLDDLKNETLSISNNRITELLSANDWKTTRHIEQLELIKEGLLTETSLSEAQFLEIAGKKQNIRNLSNLIDSNILDCVLGDEPILYALQTYLNNITPETIPEPNTIEGFLNDSEGFVNYVSTQGN